jgi:glycosyltransferase involved in cell wall biosynthesis
VVYLNSFFAPWASAQVVAMGRAGLLGDARMIVAPRGELAESALDHRWLKKKVFIRASAAVGLHSNVEWHATSAIERAHILAHLPRLRARGSVHLASMPLPPPPRGVDALWRDKPRGVLRAVYLGRVARTKRLDLAVRAFAGVEGRVSLDVFGPIEDRRYWAKCQEEAARLPPYVQVRHRGIVERRDVPSVFARHDLYVFPTAGENFGHTILEALGAGCPVLLSDRTPWTEAVRTGGGWAVSSTGSWELGEALRVAVEEDPEAWRRRHEAARGAYRRLVAEDSGPEATMSMFLGPDHRSAASRRGDGSGAPARDMRRADP